MNKLEFTNRNLENLNRCIAENGKVELMKFTELTNRLFDAIDYTRCSLQLKDEESEDFKYWYTINRYAKVDELTFKKDNKLISKTELYKYWRSKINPLIV